MATISVARGIGDREPGRLAIVSHFEVELRLKAF